MDFSHIINEELERMKKIAYELDPKKGTITRHRGTVTSVTPSHVLPLGDFLLLDLFIYKTKKVIVAVDPVRPVEHCAWLLESFFLNKRVSAAEYTSSHKESIFAARTIINAKGKKYDSKVFHYYTP